MSSTVHQAKSRPALVTSDQMDLGQAQVPPAQVCKGQRCIALGPGISLMRHGRLGVTQELNAAEAAGFNIDLNAEADAAALAAGLPKARAKAQSSVPTHSASTAAPQPPPPTRDVVVQPCATYDSIGDVATHAQGEQPTMQ